MCQNWCPVKDVKIVKIGARNQLDCNKGESLRSSSGTRASDFTINVDSKNGTYIINSELYAQGIGIAGAKKEQTGAVQSLLTRTLISDEEGDQGVTGGTLEGLLGIIIISCVQGDLPPLRPAFQRGITVQSGLGEVVKDTETTLAKDQLENHPHQK